MAKKKIVPDTFEVNGKTYKVNAETFPQINVPGVGILTAAEVLLSTEAQEYLVNEKCVGTVISEYFDIADADKDQTNH